MTIQRLLAAFALAACATFAWSCNSEGELSLEEYFEKIEELSQEEDDESGTIEEALDDLGDDATPDEIADAFDDQLTIIEDFADDMRAIDPPSEVADAHDEAVEGLDAAIEGFEGIVEDVRNAVSLEDVGVILAGVDESDFDQATEACRELQTIADDNDIDVDLRCDE